MSKEKYICIDFDGTIVKHTFPSIGDPVPGAFEWMKKFQEAGASLILWTMRDKQFLSDAINYCQDKGVEFFAWNINPTQRRWTTSPKAYASLYIDDATFGCPLVYHLDNCFNSLLGDVIDCGCGRAWVDWEEVGPKVMEWLINGDVEAIHLLKEEIE